MEPQETQAVRKPSMTRGSLRWTAIAMLLSGMLATILNTSSAAAAPQAGWSRRCSLVRA